jgi:ubiquinone/menaquinone biosynthesis C-methylase UbiE
VTPDERLELLRGGVPPGGVWADLGSGKGAFTTALAELLGPAGEIYSVDRNKEALNAQQKLMQARSAVKAHYLLADFTAPLALPPLDGMVMANVLHYLRAKEAVLGRLRAHLRPGGRLILVEYDLSRGNPWVPYPLPYRRWEALARRVGFTHTRLLGTARSRYWGRVYAAVGW